MQATKEPLKWTHLNDRTRYTVYRESSGAWLVDVLRRECDQWTYLDGGRYDTRRECVVFAMRFA